MRQSNSSRIFTIHHIHGIVVRLFWRIVAPAHPRGWLDLHPVVDVSGQTAWLHCHGMERWNLPNIEFRDVPVDLLGAAHGILFAITGYMKNVSAIGADESIGGMFESDQQKAYHKAVLRQCPQPSPDHEGFLRVVDLGEPASARFPFRLFATHLISMAENAKSSERQEYLCRRAIEIYPGEPASAPVDLTMSAENPNNYFGWESLGFALADQGKDDDAVAAFQQARLRWPEGAQGMAQHICAGVADGTLPSPERCAVSRFWCNVVDTGIRGA